MHIPLPVPAPTPFHTRVGAGNQRNPTNSFPFNKNPISEHSKVLDFAPKTALFTDPNLPLGPRYTKRT